MPWTKISSNNNATWDFENNPEVEGQLLSFKENVGPNNSRVYSIKLEDGTVVDIWGATALDRDMDLVVNGSDVKIKYLGYKNNPKTNRKFKNFEVYSQPHVTCAVSTEASETNEDNSLPF